ncbi:MAG: hypothetical protein KDC54_04735, partial [Lewinella sp.]|nr:hypothetical protein [Lewinella sp.]
ANEPADGLPQDAWIGFLREPGPDATTRPYARPFDMATQRRILTVGACLTCHRQEEPLMLESIDHFQEVLGRRSAACVLPVWE